MDTKLSPTIKSRSPNHGLGKCRDGAESDDEKNTELPHLRYTAATCDPDDFTAANGYSLRLRAAEVLIAITAFNEDASMYARSLRGIFSNIQDIYTSTRSKYWRNCVEDGGPASGRITVILVIDGLDEMGEGVADFLSGIGAFQNDIMRRHVDGREAVAHVFESVIPAGRLDAEDLADSVPVHVILIIKAKNQRKINSHRWIFNAVGRILNPEICFLVDAGTKPGPQAIYHLWKAFHTDPHLGGSCGELHTMSGRLLLNPLVAAQNFEYKMSNILDKTLESVFGYVTVLPGAFSAYRCRAIQGKPLEEYFKGDQSFLPSGEDGMQDLSVIQKNKFLAEDRILCFELIAKQGEKWTISYVKDSKAETDVPETTVELLAQRRRWLNGAFATNIYALANFRKLYHSAHGWRRLGLYHIQAVYITVSLVFSWFALAHVWLSFSVLLDSISEHALIHYAFLIHEFTWMLKFVYLAFLTTQVILALGNRPKSERVAYNVVLWMYAFLSIYLIFFPLVLNYSLSPLQKETPGSQSSHEHPLKYLLTPLSSTFGIYVLASLLYFEPWHLIHSTLQYVCLGPSYVNVLAVYAYCNLHDVSWGTKGFDKVEMVTPSRFASTSELDMHLNSSKKLRQELNRITVIEDKYKTFRTSVVAFWFLSNAVLALAVDNYGGWLDLGDPSLTPERIRLFHARQTQGRISYISALLSVTYLLVFVRFTGSLIYLGRCSVLGWCRRGNS